jgi:nicotinamidase/pyrazinamidase
MPDHAIAGTPNAAIHAAIDQAHIEVIIRKGCRPTLDSYSAFFENDRRTPTGLEGWLRQRGFTRLFLCGLATDFCVAWSAEDAVRLGFQVVIIRDACRGIGLPTADGRTTMQAAHDRLTALDVSFIDCDTVLHGTAS